MMPQTLENESWLILGAEAGRLSLRTWNRYLKITLYLITFPEKTYKIINKMVFQNHLFQNYSYSYLIQIPAGETEDTVKRQHLRR